MNQNIELLIQNEIQKYMEKNIFPIFDKIGVDYKHLLIPQQQELDTQPQELDTQPQELDTQQQELDTQQQELDTQPQELDIIDINLNKLLKECAKSNIKYIIINDINDIHNSKYENIDWKVLKKNIGITSKDINTNKKLLEYIIYRKFEILIEKKEKYYKYIHHIHNIDDIEVFHKCLKTNNKIIKLYENDIDIDILPNFYINGLEKNVNIKDILKYVEDISISISKFVFYIQNLDTNLIYKFEYKFSTTKIYSGFSEYDIGCDIYNGNISDDNECNPTCDYPTSIMSYKFADDSD